MLTDWSPLSIISYQQTVCDDSFDIAKEILQENSKIGNTFKLQTFCSSFVQNSLCSMKRSLFGPDAVAEKATTQQKGKVALLCILVQHNNNSLFGSAI